MERLNFTQINKAYQEIGYFPCNRVSFDYLDKLCCPLAALYLSLGNEEDSDLFYNWLKKDSGLSIKYIDGFMFAVDGEKTKDLDYYMEVEDFRDGYLDGKYIWNLLMKKFASVMV